MERESCVVNVGSLLTEILCGSTLSPQTALITHAGLFGLRAEGAHGSSGDIRGRIFFWWRLPDFLGSGNRGGAGEGRLSRLCLAEGGLVGRKCDCFLVFGHRIYILWIWSLLGQCKGIILWPWCLLRQCLLKLCRTLRVCSHLTWIAILPNTEWKPADKLSHVIHSVWFNYLN